MSVIFVLIVVGAVVAVGARALRKLKNRISDLEDTVDAIFDDEEDCGCCHEPEDCCGGEEEDCCKGDCCKKD